MKNPTFTPDIDGTYVIGLVVNDRTDDSVEDTVAVTASMPSYSMFVLPDTGQTTSYTNTFGEDSDYTINPLSYTDNGDGTVTDNVTGLMWQQQEDNNTYNWHEAMGTPDETYNPGGATDVCGSLTLANYSDWRLPTVQELVTIVNYGTYSTSIDTTYFPNTNTPNHWSSTTSIQDSSFAWQVYFSPWQHILHR